MGINAIINQRIVVSVSDPWQLGEAILWQPLEGEILLILNGEQGRIALIKLDDFLEYGGACWRYIVASPRHEGFEITALKEDRKIFSAFLGVPDLEAESGGAI